MQARTLLAITVSLVLFGCGQPKSDASELGSDTTSTNTSAPTSTETAETDTSETETSTDGTTQGFFMPEHDSPGGECDAFLQDCPEGEKCVPHSTDGGPWNESTCVPVTGAREPGEPCTSGGPMEPTDDCDEASMCWNLMQVDDQWVGVCTEFCGGTPESPECPPGSSCISYNDWAHLCIYGCSPLLQDCGPGTACYWVNGDFSCIPPTEDLPTGAPCEGVDECVFGHVCVAAELLPSCDGSDCCTPFCSIERGDSGCRIMPGTSCVPFFDEGEAPAGLEDVGFCVLP